MCDWSHDELPVRFQTDAGPIVNIPLNHELSERQNLTIQQQMVDSYAQQMPAAYRWLEHEADSYGGAMLPRHLPPYTMSWTTRNTAFESPHAWVTASKETPQ